MPALSRRSLVATAAALPALAGPAVAATAQPDPIFAAIEAHRVSYETWSKALSIADQYPMNKRPEREKVRMLVGHYNYKEAIETRDAQGNLAIVFKQTGEKRPIYVSEYDDLQSCAPRLSESEKQAWVDARTLELHKEYERVNREFAQTEYGKLQAAAEKIGEEEYRLLWELIRTRPTTAAGAAALFAYLREDKYLTERFFQTDRDLMFARTIELTFCALAGLPQPPRTEEVAEIEGTPWEIGDSGNDAA
jgi:hypothetical protein